VKRVEDVEGKPLPNIEEADQPIRAWEDTPLPAGLAPIPRLSALRGTRGVVVDVEAQAARLEPAFFTSSHPRMQMTSYPTGSLVKLRGMRPEGLWSFKLPEIPLSVEVNLGGACYTLPLVVDTLVMLPEQRRFYVVARRALVYQFVARRERRIRVLARQSDSIVSRPSTIRAARVDSSAGLLIVSEDDDPLIPLDVLLAMDPMSDLTESLPLCLSA